ncbi:hypothetical protein [Anatilimnocola floriformis]|uniref:hypothetical protein n=1 Tax=Anatilimnocola floriformis TaxID=2948575 RepID=UPI0020C23BD1|nr:hypothetical protein [Anatilimnocola floriformis]
MNRGLLLIAWGLLSLVTASCLHAADEKDAPPNWLSDVVKKARVEYNRATGQAFYIRNEIAKHPQGKELAKNAALEKAIAAGLRKATARQKEIEEGGEEHPAPEVAASWTIFDDCKVKRPKAE